MVGDSHQVSRFDRLDTAATDFNFMLTLTRVLVQTLSLSIIAENSFPRDNKVHGSANALPLLLNSLGVSVNCLKEMK